MKQLRDLLAAATHRRFSSEQMVNTWLDAQRIRDPEIRIAAKLSLAAAGKLATDQDRPAGPLAIDAGLQHLLDRIGVRSGRSYDEHHVDQMLQDGGITDIETRLRIKSELGMRNQLWR
ncbi:MAG TPA: hypothetical protein VGC99_28800 [Candidatus Tectomicrobia bacterium]